jgi:hypothetical protein
MKYDDIENAYYFVSMSPPYEHSVVLCKESGEMYYISAMGDSDELPEDADDPERYLDIPHKNDLDLGKSLVTDFAAEFCPEESRKVHDIFSRKGAYSRYKELLESKGLLDKWYDFEKRRTEEELRKWCGENGVELTD